MPMTSALNPVRVLPLASLALLFACPGDDGSSVDPDTGPLDTTGPMNETITITAPSVSVSETTPADSSDTGGDTSGGASTTTAADSTTATGSDTTTDGADSTSTSSTTGAAVSLWEADFSSELVMDPAADDYGPGSYVYPMGVPAGTADLRSFEMSYTAADQMLHFTVGVEAITDNTRLSLLLLDDTAWANAGVDVTFIVGGTEIRTPNWNDNGVQIVLMDPASPLYDFGAINDIDPFSDNPRPDNAIYLREANGAPFLGEDGMFSSSLDNLRRLDVTVDTMATPNTLSFDIDANWLAPYLDTTSENLYVALWSYTLIDLPMEEWFQIEFGAVELTEPLGGLADDVLENWRDCDAYDMMFFEAPSAQEEFMLVPEEFAGEAVETVVTYENVGEGVLQVPTGA